MAELPGNIHEKIGDLRIERGLTKKQVSEDLGIPASQLTRIENEDIKSIGHELIIKFADYFGVSTDYLLGRTTVRSQKNIELDELGLSNKALITLLSGKVNTELLSRIMEHSNFIPLMGYAEAYFESAHEEACVLLTQKRNEKDYEFEIEVSLMIDSDRLFEDSRPTYTNIRKYVFDKYGVKLQLKDIADVKRDYGMKMKVNKHLIKGDEPVRRKCTPNKRKYIIEALKYYHAI